MRESSSRGWTDRFGRWVDSFDGTQRRQDLMKLHERAAHDVSEEQPDEQLGQLETRLGEALGSSLDDRIEELVGERESVAQSYSRKNKKRKLEKAMKNNRGVRHVAGEMVSAQAHERTRASISQMQEDLLDYYIHTEDATESGQTGLRGLANRIGTSITGDRAQGEQNFLARGYLGFKESRQEGRGRARAFGRGLRDVFSLPERGKRKVKLQGVTLSESELPVVAMAAVAENSEFAKFIKDRQQAESAGGQEQSFDRYVIEYAIQDLEPGEQQFVRERLDEIVRDENGRQRRRSLVEIVMDLGESYNGPVLERLQQLKISRLSKNRGVNPLNALRLRNIQSAIAKRSISPFATMMKSSFNIGSASEDEEGMQDNIQAADAYTHLAVDLGLHEYHTTVAYQQFIESDVDQKVMILAEHAVDVKLQDVRRTLAVAIVDGRGDVGQLSSEYEKILLEILQTLADVDVGVVLELDRAVQARAQLKMAEEIIQIHTLRNMGAGRRWFSQQALEFMSDRENAERIRLITGALTWASMAGGVATAAVSRAAQASLLSAKTAADVGAWVSNTLVPLGAVKSAAIYAPTVASGYTQGDSEFVSEFAQDWRQRAQAVMRDVEAPLIFDPVEFPDPAETRAEGRRVLGERIDNIMYLWAEAQAANIPDRETFSLVAALKRLHMRERILCDGGDPAVDLAVRGVPLEQISTLLSGKAMRAGMGEGYLAEDNTNGFGSWLADRAKSLKAGISDRQASIQTERMVRGGMGAAYQLGAQKISMMQFGIFQEAVGAAGDIAGDMIQDIFRDGLKDGFDLYGISSSIGDNAQEVAEAARFAALAGANFRQTLDGWQDVKEAVAEQWHATEEYLGEVHQQMVRTYEALGSTSDQEQAAALQEQFAEQLAVVAQVQGLLVGQPQEGDIGVDEAMLMRAQQLGAQGSTEAAEELIQRVERASSLQEWGQALLAQISGYVGGIEAHAEETDDIEQVSMAGKVMAKPLRDEAVEAYAPTFDDGSADSDGMIESGGYDSEAEGEQSEAEGEAAAVEASQAEESAQLQQGEEMGADSDSSADDSVADTDELDPDALEEAWLQDMMSETESGATGDSEYYAAEGVVVDYNLNPKLGTITGVLTSLGEQDSYVQDALDQVVGEDGQTAYSEAVADAKEIFWNNGGLQPGDRMQVMIDQDGEYSGLVGIRNGEILAATGDFEDPANLLVVDLSSSVDESPEVVPYGYEAPVVELVDSAGALEDQIGADAFAELQQSILSIEGTSLEDAQYELLDREGDLNDAVSVTFKKGGRFIKHIFGFHPQGTGVDGQSESGTDFISEVVSDDSPGMDRLAVEQTADGDLTTHHGQPRGTMFGIYHSQLPNVDESGENQSDNAQIDHDLLGRDKFNQGESERGAYDANMALILQKNFGFTPSEADRFVHEHIEAGERDIMPGFAVEGSIEEVVAGFLNIQDANNRYFNNIHALEAYLNNFEANCNFELIPHNEDGGKFDSGSAETVRVGAYRVEVRAKDFTIVLTPRDEAAKALTHNGNWIPGLLASAQLDVHYNQDAVVTSYEEAISGRVYDAARVATANNRGRIGMNFVGVAVPDAEAGSMALEEEMLMGEFKGKQAGFVAGCENSLDLREGEENPKSWVVSYDANKDGQVNYQDRGNEEKAHAGLAVQENQDAGAVKAGTRDEIGDQGWESQAPESGLFTLIEPASQAEVLDKKVWVIETPDGPITLTWKQMQQDFWRATRFVTDSGQEIFADGDFLSTGNVELDGLLRSRGIHFWNGTVGFWRPSEDLTKTVYLPDGKTTTFTYEAGSTYLMPMDMSEEGKISWVDAELAHYWMQHYGINPAIQLDQTQIINDTTTTEENTEGGGKGSEGGGKGSEGGGKDSEGGDKDDTEEVTH